jgi:hypothetical protein
MNSSSALKEFIQADLPGFKVFFDRTPKAAYALDSTSKQGAENHHDRPTHSDPDREFRGRPTD